MTLRCYNCKTNLTGFHDTWDCGDTKTCPKCAWIDIDYGNETDEFDIYDKNDIAGISEYFLGKYNELSLCVACDDLISRDIRNTVRKLRKFNSGLSNLLPDIAIGIRSRLLLDALQLIKTNMSIKKIIVKYAISD